MKACAIRTDDGYTLLSVLILMPLFMATIAVLNASFVILKDDGATRHLCRVELLKAQSKVAKNLADLLALNPSATELREERESAEQLVTETTGTPAMPGAEINLAQVMARQYALGLKQKALIDSAKLTSKDAPRLTLERIRSLLETEHRQQGSRLAVSPSFASQTRTGEFAVVAEPASSPTPNYRPTDDFSARQEMRAQWRVDVGALVPEWLKKIIPATGFALKADCSTTLTKENLSWQSKITMGKPSSNLSSSLSF